VLVITGGRRPGLRESVAELRHFSGTILAFAERDVRVKYKQAAFGVAWVALQPLAFLAIFTLVLGRYAGVSGNGVPYAAATLSCLVPWFFIQTAVLTGSNVLVGDAPLLRKIYFPREVPVLGAVLAATLDLGVGLALFLIVGPLLGADVSLTWLLAPLLLIPLILLAAAVALALAGPNVYYRDFRIVLPFLLQLWLFASPVAYPLSAVPEEWQPVYLVVNPAAGILDALRSVLALGELPDVTNLLLSMPMLIVGGWLGYRLFKRLEPSFADVV
jgi:ABC-type polysaccharide/polyol phosphate export permease